ncbi:MAG: DNA topoisomerase VI subunit B [Candidatus Methanomethylicota archaeon]|uniref:Type 2 DNA topoisomerase 6 subunit B n=1 Tax=Thermoproteota archaeon TaxID=2056631 RepID=A0A497EVT4_9CREN|nr:MAG: DNA topoisomerase VI subunit B [Candidatus Verstraetearchaeota archaeon]
MAGFDNPVRATYTIVRELVENALDACETHGILPDIYVRLSLKERGNVYNIRVEDNGCGVPKEYIASAFGRVLFGSKYVLRQTRGTFGLGGKMAILYGQITTHSPVKILTSTGGPNKYFCELMIDIQHNKPILRRGGIKALPNPTYWHGTVIEFNFEGDYPRAKPRILEYFRQTAIILPYANITFIDPDGIIYKFERITNEMPKPPQEVRPHPHGVDVELLKRLIRRTRTKSLIEFISSSFHRVGRRTALKFLKRVRMNPNRDPRSLKPDELVKIVNAMKKFNDFLPPDASCLSPVGPKLLEQGIIKELKPEFVVAVQRKPSAYAGHPFIVEAAIAYGGEVPLPKPGEINLYRYANKIPLLYDAHSDVAMKVIKSIKWSRYKIDLSMPIAFIVHIVSTKVPYKTVGKEFIADKPEIAYEIEWALKTCARKLRAYLTRKERKAAIRRKISILEKY